MSTMQVSRGCLCQALLLRFPVAWNASHLNIQQHADPVKLLAPSLSETVFLALETCAAGKPLGSYAILLRCLSANASLQCALWCREPLTPDNESG